MFVFVHPLMFLANLTNLSSHAVFALFFFFLAGRCSVCTKQQITIHDMHTKKYIYYGHELKIPSLVPVGGPPISPGPFECAYPACPDATPLHLHVLVT